MSRKINMIELFSGIGSQYYSASKVFDDISTVATSDWDIRATIAYYLLNKENNEGTLKEVDSKDLQLLKSLHLTYNGKDEITEKQLNRLNPKLLMLLTNAIKRNNNLGNIKYIKKLDKELDVDILTYSFPCQDLSNVGSFHGYNKGIEKGSNSRSSLLWEVERLLLTAKNNKEKLPKVLLMENVSSLLSSRHSHNFETFKKLLEEIGYFNHVYLLNAKDFKSPQNRKRVIMISVLTSSSNKKNRILKEYFNSHNLQDKNYIKELNIKKLNLNKILKTNYQNEKYLEEAKKCSPNNTLSRKKIWLDNLKILDNKGKIVTDFVATITTKQDRNPNAGNLYFPYSDSKFRFLTPREAMVIMGFKESDFEKINKYNFKLTKKYDLYSRDNYYKLIGNSIVVDVLVEVFKQIKDIYELLKFWTKILALNYHML